MLRDVTLEQDQYQTAELIISAGKRGWRLGERPTVWHPRASGESKKGHNVFFASAVRPGRSPHLVARAALKDAAAEWRWRPDGGRVTDRLRRALRHPAGRLTVVFTAVSALAFGLPAALGATWLVGDNLIQNFPLRVLVGIDLRHGHLPLWDPYLWSGSPLLAGFNAGAAYPTTVLFAVLPGALAWVLNQMAVELVAAAGVVALLRVLGRSWLAAGLAAAAFAFGGFMTAQSVHLDLVQAAAWLPWAFVALDRLAHRPAGPLGRPPGSPCSGRPSVS